MEKRRSHVFAPCLALSAGLLAVLALSACSGRGAASLKAQPDPAPNIAQQLRARLELELTRLGKDVSKAGIAGGPPAGADNAVFDLSAVLVDASGDVLTPEDIAGGAVAAGVRLDWTEQLIGDYDQNGEVNVGDITALGQQFLSACAYDAPSLHGGFARWPQGSPDDAGTGGPLPANNWRRARIDGDGNGELNLADVTPIAVHWQESLSGYRVYRKGPGDIGFSLLPYAGAPPAPPDGAFTLPHSAASPSLPVRYSFADAEALATPGLYQYYCAAYDSGSGNEGRASPQLSIDTTTGVANQAPVALLSVTPDFAGAPAVISLDGSASYDSDGTIAEYQWDLDDDGMVDYDSTDPAPPAASSGGSVDSIEPGSGGNKLSATYRQGSASWIYPQLRCVDDKGLAGAWSGATLGISGWELELLNNAEQGVKLSFSDIDILDVDPATDRLVAVGRVRRFETPVDQSMGLYFGWRKADGSWDEEMVVNEESEDWWIDPPVVVGGDHATYGTPRVRSLVWTGDGQPLIVFDTLFSLMTGSPVYSYTWTARHSPNGNWTVERRWDGTDFVQSGGLGNYSNGAVAYGGGALVVVGETYQYGTTQDEITYRAYTVEDTGAPWNPVYTGFKGDPQQKIGPARPVIAPDGQPLVLMSFFGDEYKGLMAARYRPGEPLAPEQIDPGGLLLASYHIPRGYAVGAGGAQYLLYETSSGSGSYVVYELSPGHAVAHKIEASEPFNKDSLWSHPLIERTRRGFCVFCWAETSGVGGYMRLEARHFESGGTRVETVMEGETPENGYLVAEEAAYDSAQQLWGLFSARSVDNYLGRHLDPRDQ